MGFIGKALGGVVNSLTGGGGGGGGAKAFQSQHLNDTDNLAYNAIKQYAGGNQSPYTGASGVQRANAGYDYSGLNTAQQNLSQTPQITAQYHSGYKPQAYQATDTSNLQNLPQQYANEVYQTGAKTARAEGAGQLAQTQQAVGTRRPGLLAKLAQNNGNTVAQNLAGIRTSADINRANQNQALQQDIASKNIQQNQFGANLGEQQGQFGAGQGQQEYQSQYNQQQQNATNGLAYNQALANTSAAKAGLQQTGTQAAQVDQARQMQSLQAYLQSLIGSQNQGAADSTEDRGNTLKFLGNVIGAIPK